METLKLFLSGKKPDPTDVLIAAVAAAVAYVAATRLTRWSAADAAPQKILAPGLAPRNEPRATRMGARAMGLLGSVVVGAIALVGWVIAVQPKEHFVDESKLPQLAAPEDLPPVDLPGFKFVHPRLPSPTAAELATLAQNPDSLRQLRSRASDGKGNIENIALQGLIERKSIDVELLHRRLMALKFIDRGHEQVKPLALAYDWLYPMWSESQRTELRAKLAEGCEYEIDLIRKQRLSPYNVILYNAPGPSAYGVQHCIVW